MAEDSASLMDDLAEAWNAVETEEDEDTSLSAADFESDESTDDGSVDEEVSDEAADEDTADGEPESTDAGETSEAAADDGKEGVDDLETPPRGLTAKAREEWKNTPEAIRKEIMKRSEDYSKGIEKYASQAKKGDMMDGVINPHRQLFAMNNASPPQLVGQLLQTASLLQMGTPLQKAQTVAGMIKNFGIDISELDRAIVGEAPTAQTQAQSQFQEQIAPLQQELNQYRQQAQAQQQAQQQQILAEVEAFKQNPKNEFYDYVRTEMAAMMEEASRQGRPPLSLEDAYDRAIYANPEIRQIIEARKSQEAVAAKSQAASSVRGTPRGASSGGVPTGSIRDSLEYVIDNNGRM